MSDTAESAVAGRGSTVVAVRKLVAEHGGLAADAAALPAEADLHDAGLSSFAAVQLMLAIEEEFGLEFPERMLNRGTFRSIAALGRAVDELLRDAPRP